MGFTPGITIVKRPTRLQGLRERWGTIGQAKFLLARAHALEAELSPATATRGRGQRAVSGEADFSEYQREDEIYQRVLDSIERELDFGVPISIVDRSLVPTMDFWNTAVIVVVGQDGLVANTAKYVGNAPIVGVNPDPSRIDGVLLPFTVTQVRQAVRCVLENSFRARAVTLAEVELNDGQKLLAFNDFFLGRNNHVSARYTLTFDNHAEAQSSSGILISTGAGSTGWMSSVFNMARGVAGLLGAELERPAVLDWEDRRLMWAVREPFVSKHSQAGLVAGMLHPGQELIVESLMPDGGVVFSDGMDTDFLPFNSGAIARIRASKQHAHLVVG